MGRRLRAAHPSAEECGVIERTTKDGVKHKLDPSQIDELDEIDDDQQLSLVWCETHQDWEWHWLDREGA